MATLEEIRSKRKIKLLLKGLTSTGKTFTAMKIADIVLRAGKDVLFLDKEKGATEEIENYYVTKGLTDIPNFHHEDYFDFIDLKSKILKYTLEADKYGVKQVDLIIIDPLPLQQICRISATEAIKKQGFYYTGDKLVKLVNIENPDDFVKQINNREVDNKSTYALRGWQYQLSNDWEFLFKDLMVSIKPDIVVTLMLPNEKDSLEGCFDYVLELAKIETAEQVKKGDPGKEKLETIAVRTYKGIPRKVRGEKESRVVEMVNPWKFAIKPFCKKYHQKECSEVLK